jgi:hypothetical protein
MYGMKAVLSPKALIRQPAIAIMLQPGLPPHDPEGISTCDLRCCLDVAQLGHPPSPDLEHPTLWHKSTAQAATRFTILVMESETPRDGCMKVMAQIAPVGLSDS